MILQSPLPPEYASLASAEIHSHIAARKAELGSALRILGHHYQSNEVIQYADFVGDSLKLSQQAASKSDARFIVFCGVHFMAESADILSGGRAAVILPHMMAGCGMADTAEDDAVALAIDELKWKRGQEPFPARNNPRSGKATEEEVPDPFSVIPVTYVNSTAAIKAVTARTGGACCTSSNVRSVFEWAWASKAAGGGRRQDSRPFPISILPSTPLWTWAFHSISARSTTQCSTAAV